MTSDTEGWDPPLACLTKGCGRKATWQDYIPVNEGQDRSLWRLCDDHKALYDATGVIYGEDSPDHHPST